MTPVARQRRSIRAATPRLSRRGVRVRFADGRRLMGNLVRARGYWARRIGVLRLFAHCTFITAPPRPVTG